MRPLFVAALGLVLATPSSHAQTAAPSAAKAHVEFLASDKLEGREAGSAGERLAAEYLTTQLARMLGARRTARLRRLMRQTGLPPEVLQQYLTPLQQAQAEQRQLIERLVQDKEAQQQAALNGAMARFQSDPAHRYFENVRLKMAHYIKTGAVETTGDDMADLKEAYELACERTPEIKAVLDQEKSAKWEADRKQKDKDAADQARQASKSITGSPSSTVTEGRNRSGDSIEDDARDAYRSVMSSSRV